MTRVTYRHALELGHCRSGIRAYCEANGLSLTAFRKPGIPAEVFRALGDRYAMDLVAHAEEEAARHG